MIRQRREHQGREPGLSSPDDPVERPPQEIRSISIEPINPGAEHFLTDHYVGWPTVLVRLPRIGRGELTRLLENSWRQNAPKRLLSQPRP